MRHLKRRDTQQRIRFESIWDADFATRYPHIDAVKANQILHGQLADGRVIYGLDVTHQAWRLAGRGWLTAPLRWPIIRWFADKAYLGFAKHRHRLARLITGAERCQSCSLDE